jgi:signal transduction histidine kinase
MLITPTLLAAAITAMVGLLILWSNPSRNVNRSAFTCTLHLAAWLGCLHLAFTMKPGLPWLRLTCAVGAWLPMHFWIVKETIILPRGDYGRRWWRRHGGWIAVCAALAVLCFTEWFIPAHSTPQRRIFGGGYYSYIGAIVALYGFLLRDAFMDARRFSGAQRLELQVWLLGGCTTATTILALMTLNAITHSSIYTQMQPLVVLVFYIGTIYAITTHRILDARQLFLVSASETALVAVVAGAGYAMIQLFETLMPVVLAWLMATALAIVLARQLRGWSDRILRAYPRATAARLAAFEVLRRESHTDGLVKGFLRVLQGWGQTERALLLVGAKDELVGQGETLARNSPVVRALQHLRWVTPERLARERSTPERVELGRFLADRQLGVLISTEGPTLTALMGVGVPASRRPFTYPQVSQLFELGSIMENGLERAYYSVKAQHAEQLATAGLMGASLAHEIRNPLVTIKTFVQLLPQHYADPVFREKFFGLIGDEVTRIDRLTEQLLELASPRAYDSHDIELHPVIRMGLELVVPRAAGKRIEVRTDLQAVPDRVMADAAAVKQVLLNLCLNAIQAVEPQTGERWVKIATRRVSAGVEMSVEDSGPGIVSEIRPRLFQPFQSTKSSGFGLGLAVCGDIVARLDGTIRVDPPEVGRGATFRVVLPCPA